MSISRKRRGHRGFGSSDDEHGKNVWKWITWGKDEIQEAREAIDKGRCDRALTWFLKAESRLTAAHVENGSIGGPRNPGVKRELLNLSHSTRVIEAALLRCFGWTRASPAPTLAGRRRKNWGK